MICRTTTARQLLDSGTQRVAKELAGEPEVQASLLNIADAYAGPVGETSGRK